MGKSVKSILRGYLEQLRLKRARLATLSDPGDALRLIDAEIRRVDAALTASSPVSSAVRETRAAYAQPVDFDLDRRARMGGL